MQGTSGHLTDRRPGGRPVVVLMADDDEDDRLLTGEVMEAAMPRSDMRFVADGRELLDYLRREGSYVHADVEAPSPDVILLDLNMPRMTGTEVLAEIKGDEAFKSIPVVVFSTSRRPEDVAESYQLGANSYIPKPIGYDDFVASIDQFRRYWFDLVDLPSRSS